MQEKGLEFLKMIYFHSNELVEFSKSDQENMLNYILTCDEEYPELLQSYMVSPEVQVFIKQKLLANQNIIFNNACIQGKKNYFEIMWRLIESDLKASEKTLPELFIKMVMIAKVKNSCNSLDILVFLWNQMETKNKEYLFHNNIHMKMLETCLQKQNVAIFNFLLEIFAKNDQIFAIIFNDYIKTVTLTVPGNELTINDPFSKTDYKLSNYNKALDIQTQRNAVINIRRRVVNCPNISSNDKIVYILSNINNHSNVLIEHEMIENLIEMDSEAFAYALSDNKYEVLLKIIYKYDPKFIETVISSVASTSQKRKMWAVIEKKLLKFEKLNNFPLSFETIECLVSLYKDFNGQNLITNKILYGSNNCRSIDYEFCSIIIKYADKNKVKDLIQEKEFLSVLFKYTYHSANLVKQLFELYGKEEESLIAKTLLKSIIVNSLSNSRFNHYESQFVEKRKHLIAIVSLVGSKLERDAIVTVFAENYDKILNIVSSNDGVNLYLQFRLMSVILLGEGNEVDRRLISDVRSVFVHKNYIYVQEDIQNALRIYSDAVLKAYKENPKVLTYKDFEAIALTSRASLGVKYNAPQYTGSNIVANQRSMIEAQRNEMQGTKRKAEDDLIDKRPGKAAKK